MALIGSISGSVSGGVLTSNNSITGTLVVANTTTRFPSIPSDAVVFLSGSITPGSNNIVHGGYTILSGGFEVKDSTGQMTAYISQNGVISASSNITGSNIAFNGGNITSAQSTVNIVTTSTGLITFGAATSTGSFTGDFGVVGRSGLGGIVERMTHTQGGSTLTCNLIGQSIFYLNNPSSNVTANFTNVPTTTDRILTPTVILSQSSGAAYIVSVVQIDGSSQTINWANGVQPTGNLSKQDVFGFSLIRTGSGGGTTWKVLGQMSTYG